MTMPVFEYTALNAQGKKTKGLIDSENVRVARQKLRSQSIFPTDIRESAEAARAPSRDLTRFFASNKVALKDLALATRQLATLVGAGLPLVSALQALAEQTESAVMKRIVVDIREKVEGGESLAKSLGAFPKAFPRLYINMVASGEASGTLDTVLSNLADYLESQAALRRKVISSLVYPILMLCVCVAVVIILLVVVIPPIVSIFEKQHAVLPTPTRVMIAISYFIIHYWWLVVAGVAILVSWLRWYYAQPSGRFKFDRVMLKAPIFGPIFVKVTTARVARTLGALLASGVGLLTAIDIARNIISNVHVIKALEDARDGVREGRSLAKELQKSQIFPTMLYHMVAIGEKSGELEDMLQKAGRTYESEVNSILSGLTSLLEPVMLIIVGVVVLVIMLSVFLPMTNMINALQH